ncbi:MAG: efflux RND transporter periplasmic adaptor subunit [Bryobacterales bacterium]|nr:efflux RND transporter periplasmic adaptor subunit [Bryobacterales bacterium]
MQPSRIALSIALVGAGVLLGFGYGRWYATGTSATEQVVVGYHCPMHPAYHSDKPGQCGICGMRLVQDGQNAAPHQHEAGGMTGERKPLYYRDPKQPEYRSDKPGVNPATGGDLEPVYTDDAAAMPMGTIHVPQEKQQLIGVKFEAATAGGGSRGFRAVGKVTTDETRVAKVQTKIEGWIDQVHVDFTGKLVEKGQPLLTLYSPEMLATQQEYLLAIRSRELMRSSPLASSREQSDSLLEATRKRLQLWDLSDAQIDEITRTGKPIKNITLYSPIGGYVMMRNAFPKQRITPETELYTVADLSRVWIMADVFESDAPSVRVGMPVVVSLPYENGRKLTGRVDYIQPQVDMTTRTLKVRIDVNNPQLSLRPDMFVNVDFQVATASRVTVPSEAVLNSGLRTTVFVDLGQGYLEPRQVTVGERLGSRVEITSGLREGERVVTSGNFLIDSESQLKSAAAGMAGHQHGSAPPSPSAPPPPAQRPAPPGEHKHD